MDVIKTRLMNAAGGTSQYSGMLDGLAQVARQEGFSGLYKVRMRHMPAPACTCLPRWPRRFLQALTGVLSGQFRVLRRSSFASCFTALASLSCMRMCSNSSKGTLVPGKSRTAALALRWLLKNGEPPGSKRLVADHGQGQPRSIAAQRAPHGY